MNSNVDIDLDNISTMQLNLQFWGIVYNMPGMVKAERGKAMTAFEKLEIDQKTFLLEELEGRGVSARRPYIEHFLFEGGSESYEEDEEEEETVVRKPRKIIFDAGTAEEEQKQAKPQVANPMAELERLTGLKGVKEQVRELIAFIEMAKLRKQRGLKTKNQTLHMMFRGNPGTGKTTIARLLGKIFKNIGVLTKGHVIEIDRSNLISKYQGEIERKIMEYVEEAEGGILFIDEIYSMYKQGDESDQGKQGIEVLLKAVEDYGHKFICIGAGYNDEVDTFLSSNPGLPSRFPIQIQFEDYTEEELVSIAVQMFSDEDYNMDAGFQEEFKKVISKEKENKTFGNARVVRNIVESSIRQQSLRLWNDKSPNKTTETLMSVVKEDLKYVPIKLKNSLQNNKNMV